MEPYLVCIFLRPTVKESEEGVSSKIIVDSKTVMAKDQAHAASKALKYVPEEFEGVDERLEVRVLQFQKSCR